MTEENTVLKFGSPELSEAVQEGESNFFKTEIGIVYEIEVLKDKGAIPKVMEYDGKPVQRFDISIVHDGKELIWSIGKRNCAFIDNAETNKFNVLRTDKGYNIIPLTK